MKIYLIRHGKTENTEILLDSQIDPNLANDNKLPAEFDTSTIQQIWTSPLKRCIQTSELLDCKKIIADDSLTEMNLGSLSGRKLNILTYIHLSWLYLSNSGRYSAETPHDFTKRVNHTFDRIVTEAKSRQLKSIAIVSHNGFLLVILRRFGLIGKFTFKVKYLTPYPLEIE